MSMPDTRKQLILNTAADLAQILLWDGRQEDEELPNGAIEEAIAAGEITADEITARFHSALLIGLGTE
jgi:hypothetical protein